MNAPHSRRKLAAFLVGVVTFWTSAPGHQALAEDPQDPAAASEDQPQGEGKFETEELGQVEMAVTPLGAPILIPAEGGLFHYVVELENRGAAKKTYQLWIEIRDDSQTSITRGPLEVVVFPGNVGYRALSQGVPANASGGPYSLTAFIGNSYPEAIQTASFTWEKAGPRVSWLPTLEP